VAIRLKIKLLIRLTILIFGGYLPGNFPPIEASPHGIPRAKPNWNKTRIAERIAKMIAEMVTIILTILYFLPFICLKASFVLLQKLIFFY
jgi:hypothetical protein